jgi:hypothetical protein
MPPMRHFFDEQTYLAVSQSPVFCRTFITCYYTLGIMFEIENIVFQKNIWAKNADNFLI